MCEWGNTKQIIIRQEISVDSCIAEEIKWLNNKQGIRTEQSCCGHGDKKPLAAIKPSSKNKAKELGYDPVYNKEARLFEIKLKQGVFKMKSELVFAWEDPGVAGLKYFKCGECGKVKHWKVTNTKIVNTDGGYVCPECNKEFQLTWKGMEWEEK